MNPGSYDASSSSSSCVYGFGRGRSLTPRSSPASSWTRFSPAWRTYKGEISPLMSITRGQKRGRETDHVAGVAPRPAGFRTGTVPQDMGRAQQLVVAHVRLREEMQILFVFVTSLPFRSQRLQVCGSRLCRCCCCRAVAVHGIVPRFVFFLNCGDDGGGRTSSHREDGSEAVSRSRSRSSRARCGSRPASGFPRRS